MLTADWIMIDASSIAANKIQSISPLSNDNAVPIRTGIIDAVRVCGLNSFHQFLIAGRLIFKMYTVSGLYLDFCAPSVKLLDALCALRLSK
jgi:hypothetical protein